MDCLNAQKLVRPYLEGQLSDRELEEFLDHVEQCPVCYDELEVYYSIYHTLNDRSDGGNYNFTEKLDRRLDASRRYLKRRFFYKIFRVVVILTAEAAMIFAFWVLYSLPGRTSVPGGSAAEQTTESAVIQEAVNPEAEAVEPEDNP